MFKGYRKRLIELDNNNKFVSSLSYVNKCAKCNLLNNVIPSKSNYQFCSFCGNPFYIYNKTI